MAKKQDLSELSDGDLLELLDETKDEMLNLLKAQAPEVVKESVHAAALSKFMNEKSTEFSDGGPKWWANLLDGISRTEATVLSITKKK